MNEYRFHCPECRRRLKIAVQLSGHQIRCPACQQVIRVPPPPAELAPDGGLPRGDCETFVDPGVCAAEQSQTRVYWRRKQPPTSSTGQAGQLKA